MSGCRFEQPNFTCRRRDGHAGPCSPMDDEAVMAAGKKLSPERLAEIRHQIINRPKTDYAGDEDSERAVDGGVVGEIRKWIRNVEALGQAGAAKMMRDAIGDVR